MPLGLDEVTALHVKRAVDSLVDEFGGRYERVEIDRLVRDSLALLLRGAEVNDFVPTLAYRFARERLLASTHERGTGEAEVLFVGLGDTGRGQMAAALTQRHSQGRIVAHSAGSTAGDSIDPTVVQAMADLEVDLGESYAKPLTDEVLRGVDVVVTMGRSVGQITVPDGTRHVDWRVGDPTGADLEEVRRVRDDIERRVQALVSELSRTPEPAGVDATGRSGEESSG